MPIPFVNEFPMECPCISHCHVTWRVSFNNRLMGPQLLNSLLHLWEQAGKVTEDLPAELLGMEEWLLFYGDLWFARRWGPVGKIMIFEMIIIKHCLKKGLVFAQFKSVLHLYRSCRKRRLLFDCHRVMPLMGLIFCWMFSPYRWLPACWWAWHGVCLGWGWGSPIYRVIPVAMQELLQLSICSQFCSSGPIFSG